MTIAPLSGSIIHSSSINSSPTVQQLHEAIKNKESLTQIASFLTPQNVNVYHEGFTTLHQAIISLRNDKELQMEVVKYLVDKERANIEATTRDESGKTPLYLAAELGLEDVVQYLVDKNAKVNTHCGINRWTALHAASTKGHYSVVQRLVDAKSNIDDVTKDNETSLYLAIQHFEKDVVKYLISKGASIHQVCGPDKWTPLHMVLLGQDQGVLMRII